MVTTVVRLSERPLDVIPRPAQDAAALTDVRHDQSRGAAMRSEDQSPGPDEELPARGR